MERKYPGFTNDASKADVLRRAVDESPDDRARLAALLTLARHYVDVADGVNGFATAKLARSLALQLKDFVSAAHALNSVSVSQYHRSEYVSAIATALDAWDYATRSRSAAETADSYFSMAFSLFGLGALDTAEQVVAKGLASVSDSAQFLEPRIRLLRLRGILFQARGSMDDVRTCVVSAVYLGRLYLEREDPGRAATVLRHAVTQARRGAADDVLGYARSLLATALERMGSGEEAAKERSAAAALRREVSEDRRRALEEASRLVARIVDPPPSS